MITNDSKITQLFNVNDYLYASGKLAHYLLSMGRTIESCGIWGLNKNGPTHEDNLIYLEDILSPENPDFGRYYDFLLDHKESESEILTLDDVNLMQMKFSYRDQTQTFIYTDLSPFKARNLIISAINSGEYGTMSGDKRKHHLYVIFQRIPDTPIDYDRIRKEISGEIYIMDMRELSLEPSEHFFSPRMERIPKDDLEELMEEFGFQDIRAFPIIYLSDVFIKLQALTENQVIRFEFGGQVSYRRIFKTPRVYVRK